MNSIIALLSGLVQAFNNIFSAKNRKDVIKQKEIQNETDQQNKVEKAIAQRDVNTVRDALSD